MTTPAGTWMISSASQNTSHILSSAVVSPGIAQQLSRGNERSLLTVAIIVHEHRTHKNCSVLGIRMRVAEHIADSLLEYWRINAEVVEYAEEARWKRIFVFKHPLRIVHALSDCGKMLADQSSDQIAAKITGQ